MTKLVEVTLTLEQNDAAKLVDLAGGEGQVNAFAATVIQSLQGDEPTVSPEAHIDQMISEAQAFIDRSG